MITLNPDNVKTYDSKASLYNPKFIDFTKEPMFLGTGRNTQKFDIMKYPIFDNLNDKMQGLDWRHDEIKLTPDKIDYETKMLEPMKHAYTRVLQKLIFLDSLQGRGILSSLGLITTIPELENCMLTWQYFEGAKHSKSYTEVLRGVYPNPGEIFDESFKIPELMYIAKSISEPYNICFELVTEYNYCQINGLKFDKIKELKLAILRLLVTINILEGVRFYSGFVTIWSLHYSQGLMERTGNILQLICRDENMHLAITQTLLNILKTKEDEGFVEVYKEFKHEIHKLYEEAYKDEEVWIDLLFSKGSFLGMNADIAKTYIKYTINRRLKAIGENILFKGYDTNPVKWADAYINSDKNEVLPQETEILNYRTDILNREVSDNDLESLKTML